MENEKLKMDDESIDNYSDLIEFLLNHLNIPKIEEARDVRRKFNKNLDTNFDKNEMDDTNTEQNMNLDKNLYENLNLFLNQDKSHDIHDNDKGHDHQKENGRIGSETISTNSNSFRETDSSHDQIYTNTWSEDTDSGHNTILLNEIFTATDNLLETISYFDLHTVYDMQLYLNGEGLRQILKKIPKGFVFGEVSWSWFELTIKWI